MSPLIIEYQLNGPMKLDELGIFFRNSDFPPSDQAVEASIEGSDLVVTAREDGKLIGFLTVITDGGIYAWISTIKVLPPHRDRDVPKNLIDMAVSELGDIPNIVVSAVADTTHLLHRFGFRKASGLSLFDRQL